MTRAHKPPDCRFFREAFIFQHVPKEPEHISLMRCRVLKRSISRSPRMKLQNRIRRLSGVNPEDLTADRENVIASSWRRAAREKHSGKDSRTPRHPFKQRTTSSTSFSLALSMTHVCNLENHSTISCAHSQMIAASSVHPLVFQHVNKIWRHFR